jgi:hypothetical protein
MPNHADQEAELLAEWVGARDLWGSISTLTSTVPTGWSSIP